jgi:hypothetical protein
MPRIEVLTEVPGSDHQVMLTEHVPSEMFADEHYADQLIERMGWALLDAEEYEQRFPSDGIVGLASAGPGG